MKILFMCVANSARSQLAEGLARHLFEKHTEIESAGSQPSKVNPVAVQVLSEEGIDISRHFSKSVDDLSPEFLATLDYVITLCTEEVCPVLISKARKIHWTLHDPAVKGASEAELLEKFRATRDELKKRLLVFGRDLNLI